MPKHNIDIGDELTIRTTAVRVDEEKVTISFDSGFRHTIQLDSPDIVEVRKRRKVLRDRPD